jgi:hypothetical protein
MSTEIEWMLKEPGPLLLIERNLFKAWKGNTGSSINDSKRTDYERANSVRKAVTSLEVGERDCLIITKDRIIQAAWIPDEPAGGIIVTSDEKIIPTDDVLQEILAKARPRDWKDTKLDFTVGDLHLRLVSAVESPPHTVFGSLEVILDKGIYRVKSAHYEDESWYLDFYRLIPRDVEVGPAKIFRIEAFKNTPKQR